MERQVDVTGERIVVYTAIFGEYDQLHEPKTVPEGIDYVCFSDRPLKSHIWQVRVVDPPLPNDSTRSARMYKELPHRFLGSYDVSVWVDGNILVRGDARTLVEKYLTETSVAVFDHAHTRHRDKERSSDARTSVQNQLEHLLALAERGRVKDDPVLMQKQVQHYLDDGYPDDQGVLMSCVMVRRHNDEKVREAMEAWWSETKKWSKRDQLSFNYVAWKHNLPFTYIEEDVRDNEFSITMSHKK